jgi:hypothetical protein
MSEAQVCEELGALEDVKVGSGGVCDECVKSGDRWVHLRTCQTCGGTHCCDSSPNKHATAHWKGSGHPVIASAEPGEKWLWCYVHEAMVGY